MHARSDYYAMMVVIYSPYAVDHLDPLLEELMSGLWDRDCLVKKSSYVLKVCAKHLMTRH